MLPNHEAPDPRLKVSIIESMEQGVRIALEGSISHDTSVGLLQELLKLSDTRSGGDVTLDLALIDFVDSQGIGVICGLHHELEIRQASLKIVNANAPVQRVLKIMRLDQLFDVA